MFDVTTHKSHYANDVYEAQLGSSPGPDWRREGE